MTQGTRDNVEKRFCLSQLACSGWKPGNDAKPPPPEQIIIWSQKSIALRLKNTASDLPGGRNTPRSKTADATL